MIKLFFYELRRMLFNKFFFCLLVITAFFSRQVMRADIIVGVANTAPFSGWSYGTYLAKILPVLLVALLFFIYFLYSEQEKNIRPLTEATPVDPLKFRLLRCGAIFTAFLLISAVPIGYSLWFYKAIFRFTDFGSFVLPIVVTLIPAMLFVFGLGLFVGRIHSALLLALMPVVILLGFLSLPYAADFFCSNFFAGYPASLKTVEPPFALPLPVWAGRCVYSLAGLAFLFVSTAQKEKQPA